MRLSKAGSASSSDLVLLVLAVLGKIIPVPKHLQAGEAERYLGSRDEVAGAESLGRAGEAASRPASSSAEPAVSYAN